jgi:hypothetical protein
MRILIYHHRANEDAQLLDLPTSDSNGMVKWTKVEGGAQQQSRVSGNCMH